MHSSLLQPAFLPSLLGPITLVTAPTELPVTRDEVKDHCLVDFDDDDIVLDRQIAAAVRYVERSRGWTLMPTTYNVALRAWWNRPLRMPRGPLVSVTWVKYYDPSGTLTTLDAANYLVHAADGLDGSIERAPEFCWPNLQLRAFPITTRLVAGYAAAAQVPETAKHAIYQTVDWLYENRGSADAPLPSAITNLLDAEAPGGYA
jgi:uncharacterized phiE125 gp8 family phage protein